MTAAAPKPSLGRLAPIIITEARRRGISVTDFLVLKEPLILMEYQKHREFLYNSITNREGRVTAKIILHKGLTTALLRQAEFAVPEEIFTDDINQAQSFLKQHGRIVVKPFDRSLGIGVRPGIRTEAELRAAMQMAQTENEARSEKRIICQKHVDGLEYRLLVVGFQHVFAVQRVPAYVVADGVRSVEDLVASHNEAAPDSRQIVVTDTTVGLIKEQKLEATSVPAVGQRVQLARVANAHMGGTVHDVTDDISQAVLEKARAVARYFNTPLVGIDCISPDISTTLGYIIELNSPPDFTLHLEPTTGQPRNVAGAIVDMLFPETAAATI